MSSPHDPSATNEMSGEPQRLDGNAAAGFLAEIFTFDMTSAQSTCEGCGRTGPLGVLLLYGGEMGAVLRCPTCDHAQIRITRIPEHDGRLGQYYMDMRGTALLRIIPSMLA